MISAMSVQARRFGAMVLACVAGGVTSQAQTLQQERPPATNSFIMGQIVNAAGAPVAGAVVTLSGGLVQISLTTAARELEGGPRRTITDHDGRFVFSDLSAGSYTLDAAKPGYLPGAYGRRRFGGQPQSLSIADGERNTAIRIPIWEFGAIGGTIVDEAGEPMVGIMVTAHRDTFVAMQRRLTHAATVTTDDRGAYRIDGLSPGTYSVCVPTTHVSIPIAIADQYQQSRAGGQGGATSPPAGLVRLVANADLRMAGPSGLSGRRVGDVLVPTGAEMPPQLPETGTRPSAYTVTCYPGATPADAQRLTLESGDQRDGINISLQPVPTAPVSGTLVDHNNGEVGSVSVRLLPSYRSALASDIGAETAVALTNASGAFMFPSVPLGQYTLKVLRTPAGGEVRPSSVAVPSAEPTGWAEMPLTVGEGGLANLAVELQRGFRLSGRLELDGTSANKPGPDLIERFSISLAPADGSDSTMPAVYSGLIDRDGRISSNEIPPGRYVVLFRAFADDRVRMAGWETVGATIDGRDASHQPFDLTRDVTTLVMTLSDHAAQIAGTARDSRGQADPGAAVILFPADRARWTGRGFSQRGLRLVRASRDGAYRFGSVPPGDYFVAAIPDEEAGDWENPEVLTAAMRIGSRVSISPNEKMSLDVVTTALRMGGR
jgi:protocatechuate 3,4-dioxygenase beta subunit